MKALIMLAVFAFAAASPLLAAGPMDALKEEHARVEKAIVDAAANHDQLEAGLVKSLIAARLEILRINAALIQQRVHALESGAKITISIGGVNPDPQRATDIANEIRQQEQRLTAQMQESAKYSGGLVKAMSEATVATSRLSIEMLNTELLKAKYGIGWLPPSKPSSDQEKSVSAAEAPKIAAWQHKVEEPAHDSLAKNLLVFTATRKKFQASDFRSRIYQDTMTFDVEWDTSRLKQPTRAVKGIMIFADPFGEARFRIRTTIDKPMTPGKKFVQAGIGFEYNQFSSDHQWMLATDLPNMTFRFDVQEILYADGTREKF